MNIDSVKQHISKLTDALSDLFKDVDVEYAFGEGRPFIGDESDENFRGMLGGHLLAKGRGGVYLFVTQDNEIVYIGKSTNGLHDRTMSHVGVPKRLENGWMTFPSPSKKFSVFTERPDLLESIRDGKIFLHVFSVSDVTVVSLIEVYLQTVYLRNMKRLPYFNNQIG